LINFFGICSYFEKENDKEKKIEIEVLFNELISLLPDNHKVNELYEIYVQFKKQETGGDSTPLSSQKIKKTEKNNCKKSNEKGQNSV